MQIIRKMQETDLPEVMRIEHLVFSLPWPEEAFEATSHSDYYVIYEDQRLQGYILYHTVLDEGMIINFAIDPACQRQGLGTLLLQHTLHLLFEKGFKTFFLDVRESNQAAKNLYAKFGFSYLGIRKNYYSMPAEDAIVMVKHADE